MFHRVVHESIVRIADGEAWQPQRRSAQSWPTYRRQADRIIVSWESVSRGALRRNEEANMEHFLSMRPGWPFGRCPQCGLLFRLRSRAKYCSSSCRRKVYRAQQTTAEKVERAAYMREWRRRRKASGQEGKG